MRIVIPMAGIGKRMRPHTLSTPKPLLPVIGKPIVQLLLEDLVKMMDEKVDEVAFIIGDFGVEAENELKNISHQLGLKPFIYYQKEALGTAHAIWCAAPFLEGNVLIAFADTLFKTDFIINKEEDGIIWTKKIENPKLFGVVVPDENNYVKLFAEKPKEFVSDLAIIGIYYFKNGEYLKEQIQYIIDNDIRGNNEYQLTDVLENMKNQGQMLKIAMVDGWYDCGNKNATIETNTEMLKLKIPAGYMHTSVRVENTTIVQPCFIDQETVLKDSSIGPFVSIGRGTIIENSKVTDSIIMDYASISDSKIKNSMLGNHTTCKNQEGQLNIGDYSELL
jgi:glucose-1-phosphate thymidylyltransferase